MGEMGILNVGAGDTKLSFDKNNPAEVIRSARIVRDMIRRGYALIIQVPPKKKGGAITYQRVDDFREETCEYIIADLDPEVAAAADAEEGRVEKGNQTTASAATPFAAAGEQAPKRGRWRPRRAIPAASTSGVAVARSAGG